MAQKLPKKALIILDSATALVDEQLERIPAVLSLDLLSQHPGYTLADWRYEVAEDSTSRGYWHWVACKLLEADEDDD